MNNKNNELPMMGGMLSGSAFLPTEEVSKCASFRDAVLLAWRSRRAMGMTKARLAEVCELLPQHLSDYLSNDEVNPKGQRRRSLPADKIAAFEAAVGNRAITQYLVRQVNLNLMEEWQAQMAKKVA
ncbi:XRE family transcriptional regulator [Paraburkholderia sp. D15]|uniref:XRE family transcriptional regulator n=1 Tax=Paraburkholderia sp. D15 TaxID=2880218 RepID=UPI002479824E|nr:XRE family transcriptional regulator [Paraburkholderia sp. D15]WGS53546.1 XRE family transcriptional regulator [Paraburkholderia sp. D15]